MDTSNRVCGYWDEKRSTCTYNKKEAMVFLNKVGAIVKNHPESGRVDFSTWSSSEWAEYYRMMMKLASGNGGLNFLTEKIGCGENNLGINPLCKQWGCEEKAKG